MEVLSVRSQTSLWTKYALAFAIMCLLVPGLSACECKSDSDCPDCQHCELDPGCEQGSCKPGCRSGLICWDGLSCLPACPATGCGFCSQCLNGSCIPFNPCPAGQYCNTSDGSCSTPACPPCQHRDSSGVCQSNCSACGRCNMATGTCNECPAGTLCNTQTHQCESGCSSSSDCHGDPGACNYWACVNATCEPQSICQGRVSCGESASGQCFCCEAGSSCGTNNDGTFKCCSNGSCAEGTCT